MLKLLLLLISISICNASNCTNDKIFKIDDNRIKILDPLLNMGQIKCTDHGEHMKGCNNILLQKPLCILTPIENQEDGKCYHYSCSWQSKDNFDIMVVVDNDYETILVDMYPNVDMSPTITFVLTLGILIIWICMMSSKDPFNAGIAGGLLFSSWYEKGNYCSISGIC